jgi:hypothetical protein
MEIPRLRLCRKHGELQARGGIFCGAASGSTGIVDIVWNPGAGPSLRINARRRSLRH